MSERDTHIRTQAVRHMVEARRRSEAAPTEVLPLFDPIVAATRKRLVKIESLLRQGRDAEAILLANVGAWGDRARGENLELGKANFNPDEPRDDRTKEWTTLGSGSDDAHLDDVQYRGHFHNLVVDDFLGALNKVGAKTAKNITVTGINGVRTIPDGLVFPVGGQEPYFIEVKTGFDPPFTPNQLQVYPLICLGYHATSGDARLADFGLKAGVPFPPIGILLITTSGPEMPMYVTDYCKSIGLR